MSILKRIFGDGNKESDKQVQKEIDQIESGEITKVYPILKPGDWIGIKAGVLKQTLIGTQEEPELVIGYGYDTPSNFVFLRPKDIEGKDSKKVLDDAYANLEAVDSPFVASARLNGKVLTASGNDFSAEKILSKNHMMKAHEMLNSDELLVSIPRRRCMMVTSRKADDETLNIFTALHRDAWEDDSFGNPPIMNALFVVINGKIDGIISFDRKEDNNN